MHHVEMVAIDGLLRFYAEPEKYNPQKLSLAAYLRMAARGDMLNLLAKDQRREQHMVELENLSSELEQNFIEEHFALDEWLAQHTKLSRQELLAALDVELEVIDKEVLLLMLEGVRETHRYAQVMGIADQDEKVQRRAVKRAKDRLIKQLQRFGQRMGKGES
jgi:RNA polymerase sigma-70 factor (ECF subfamily)